ncbi:hypothetical protein GIB67_002101 [Kingdonia uniflora]|uniref:Uncharacterized protein n=1 Tax=Kingdonia uniflora TaxID=39325 RepID=A0A7J7KWG1_9MAGN|nr:hypothetical protein GIB67_002101 [Kingdonia uniflora]
MSHHGKQVLHALIQRDLYTERHDSTKDEVSEVSSQTHEHQAILWSDSLQIICKDHLKNHSWNDSLYDEAYGRGT